MSALLLSINAGSSSVKITLFTFLLQQDGEYGSHQTRETYIPVSLAEARVNSLFSSSPLLSYSRGSRKISASKVDDVNSHTDGVGCILSTMLADTGLEALAEKSNITHVCHRILHGGNYCAPHVIDEEAYRKIHNLADLAPL
jgi:acetate kinase